MLSNSPKKELLLSMSYFYGSQLVHLKVEQILWHVLTSIALTIKTSLLHNNYIAPESMVFNQFSFFSDTKEEYDATGKKTYFELCKRLDSTPVSYFIKHMGDTEINLAYHGIGTKGAKAVAGALVVSLIYDFFLYPQLSPFEDKFRFLCLLIL